MLVFDNSVELLLVSLLVVWPGIHLQNDVKLVDASSRLPLSSSIVIPKGRTGSQMQRQDAALLSMAMVVSPLCALARMSAATALRIVWKLCCC